MLCPVLILLVRWIGTSTCFKAFLRASVIVISAFAGLGVGAQLSYSIVSGCEEFVCQLFNSNIATAKAFRWNTFKQLKSNQGVEKLFLTQCAIIEHILRRHTFNTTSDSGSW